MDNSTSTGDNESLGCGSQTAAPPPATTSSPSTSSSPINTIVAAVAPQMMLTLNVQTTTGGNFTVVADPQNSVENLKKTIAKKLKVSKDRISLLFRERELQESLTIKENGLMEGSRIVLIPNVETGLLAQRPENTVMQALESLNDTQVNDFLSGKTPLNLSMRLGDHMMLIQLQLSTANPKPNEVGNSSVPNSTTTSSSRSNRSSHHHHHHSHRIKTCVPQPAPVAHQSSASRKIDVDSPQSSVPLSEADIHRIKNKVNSVNNPLLPHIATESTTSTLATQNVPAVSVSAAQPVDLNKNTATAVSGENINKTNSNNSSSSYKPLVNTDMEQSPIKSLSNLVSGPIKTTMKNIPANTTTKCDSNATTTSPPQQQQDNNSPSPMSLPDPISAKLTSCLCTRLSGGKPSDVGCHDTTCNNKPQSSSSSSKYIATKIRERRRTIPYGSQPISSSSLKQSLNRKMQPQRQQPQPQTSYTPSTTTPAAATTTTTTPAETQANSTMTMSDNMALAEASRNLTQTLRKLSKDVFCHKIDHQHHSHHHTAAEATSERKIGSGAVIESMKNHGKGIYSGTFSGTLNPALQDRYGRPKRDISTVIHILNDLLSATPHYTRGAKFSLEPALNSSGSTMLHTKYRMNDYRKNQQQQQQQHHHHHQSSSSSLKCQRCVKPSEYSSSGSSTSAMDVNTDLSSRNNSSLLANSLNTSSSPSTLYSSHCSNKICTLDNRNTCACRTDDLSGEREMCSKCSSELENSKTKYKMDHLRLVMQQRKEKREARKLKGAPYGARLAATTTTATATAAGPATTSPSEPHIIEEVDTVA